MELLRPLLPQEAWARLQLTSRTLCELVDDSREALHVHASMLQQALMLQRIDHLQLSSHVPGHSLKPGGSVQGSFSSSDAASTSLRRSSPCSLVIQALKRWPRATHVCIAQPFGPVAWCKLVHGMHPHGSMTAVLHVIGAVRWPVPADAGADAV